MRSFRFIPLVLMLAGSLCAQDSIRAVNIFRHNVENGKMQREKWVTEQKTYDLDDRLVVHIRYFDSIPNIKTFTRYFYRNEQLVSKEQYDHEQRISRVVRYQYNKDGLLTEKRQYVPGKNKMVSQKTVQISYSDTLPDIKTVLNQNDKWIRKHRFSYEDQRITETIRYHKKRSTGELLSEEIVRICNGKQILEEIRHQLDRSKQSHVKRITFAYDADNGQLTEEKHYTDSLLTARIEYSWFVNGTLNRKLVYNASDELTDHLSYRYLQRILTLGAEPAFDLAVPVDKQGLPDKTSGVE